MATIRLAVIERMKKNFDQTAFSRHMFDFSINQKDHILQVTFLGNEKFQFTIKEVSPPKQNRFKFVTIESPGDVSNEVEQFDHETLNNAQSRAHSWAVRIEEDYRIAAPEDNELENFRTEFFASFDHSKTADEHFTEDEKSVVTKKMKEFEKKLATLYEERHANHQQMNEMRRQIEMLKKSVEILDKRTWLSAACNRVFDIVKEVKGAKKEISNLLGDMSNLLPDNSSVTEESQDEVA
ncbi:hypothetical protein tinsulaeT_38410 [Thalassotalea insulae]|uniref:Uncharacterized protein n=1 Tax=Thalassotalea insulae TaxID=2056778 RepID=A0ABQ6GX38_9GAMM|nr:hypothetical protein [Thalassotalea insulae]GLX80501.1 hypothetical protein tinsulaeT_38410 [Thalassotalea insulae]